MTSEGRGFISVWVHERFHAAVFLIRGLCRGFNHGRREEHNQFNFLFLKKANKMNQRFVFCVTAAYRPEISFVSDAVFSAHFITVRCFIQEDGNVIQ